MAFLVMYSPNVKLISYDEVIAAGGHEVPDAREYLFRGEAVSLANKLNKDEDEPCYLVVAVGPSTDRQRRE